MFEPKRSLQLRIICHNPPPAAFNGVSASIFGLQDKKGVVDSGQPQPDSSRMFFCTVEANLTENHLDFSGAYVQGTKGARFLYLSWAYDGGGWVQRIKIPLSAITNDQVASGKSLQVIIENGRASGTVKLNEGWKTV